ncbi:MAG: DUF885 domain-containing protein [Gammaproteobacteria bacterium]|nr:DUF885 domain-containing protein [Gammaproteobacteria bacterium]
MLKTFNALLLLVVFCAGCDGGMPAPSATSEPSDATADRGAASAAAHRLDTLFEDHWQATLELDPVRATFIGDHRYNDRYPVNISSEHRAATRTLLETSLAAAERFVPEALDDNRRLSLELFIGDLRHELAGFEFPEELLPVNQFRNPANQFAMLGSGTSAQPFDTVRDYENFLARMAGFSAWVDQAIVNMRAGIEAGVVQPAILMERTLPQLQAHMVASVEGSLFWRPIEAMPMDIAEDARMRVRAAYEDAIMNTVVPAYTRLHDFIRDEYLPSARQSVGMYALPDGEVWYAYLVRHYTTTDLAADEIHQIGLDEVGRIHAEMIAIKQEVSFEGDLQAFFEHLNTDPAFYFETREQMIEAHEALREQADAAAPRLFKRIPRADYEIRPVEAFRERSAAKGSYQRPSADGSRPGIFYVNTWNPQARPRWDTEALFLHEAVPGHHFQRSFNLEMEDLPSFRRHGGVTAFAEGWGLYSESRIVGEAMGFYSDPYQRFGQLNAELWRAIRLVVDTGLHAKRWSRQDVLDYMYANSATLETRAVSEAERFMAIPGQALAYKIGQLRLMALRERAETVLGENFDIREFHEQVLGQGDLPLDVLEARIERWLSETSG